LTSKKVTKSRKGLTTLWEKGENPSSATGVATANVTSTQSSHGDRTDGIASNQSVVSFSSKVILC
jgi:hypothetical protein